MANNLTMTGDSYGTGKFGTALLAGSGAITGAYPAATNTYTFEGWVKTTLSGGNNKILSSIAGGSIVYMDPNGRMQTQNFNGLTGPVMNDGAWHHIRLVGTTTSETLYQDGVAIGSGAATTQPAGGLFTIGRHQNFTGFDWGAGIDEFVVWSTALNTANFTPPTAPYASGLTGMYSLYHFDGNGLDSATAVAAPNAPTIGTATAGTGQVSVTFTPASTGGTASSFTATFTPTTGAPSSATGTASPIVITGLAGGVAGTVHVTATNTGGTSAASAESNSVTPTAAPVNVTMTVTDTKAFWAPYVWDLFSGYKQTVYTAAYCQFIFSGTAIAVGVDVSPLVNAGLSSVNYPRLRLIVDGASNTDVQLTPSSTSVSVSGLSDSTHTFRFELDAIGTNSGELWNGPSNCLRVTGFSIDAGRAFSAWTATLPDNEIFFGDSTWHGYLSLANGTVMPAANSAAIAIPTIMANAHRAEFGAVCFSGQGYEQAANTTPNFLNSWSYYSNGRSRLDSNGKLVPAPKRVIIGMGVNGATTAADVQNISVAIRTAAPNALICHVVPANGSAQAAIQAGVAAVNDPKTILVDTNSAFAAGINNYGSGPNLFSLDGLHPNALSNSRAGAGMVRKMQLVEDGIAAPTLNSRTATFQLATGRNPDESLIYAANVVGAKISIYDESSPDLHTVARYKTASGTFDSTGTCSITYQSTLASGGTCTVVVWVGTTRYTNSVVVS